MSADDMEHRIRELEKKITELATTVQPLVGLHALVSGMSNQIVELRGDLKAIRAQGATIGAVVTILVPLLVKLLHLV